MLKVEIRDDHSSHVEGGRPKDFEEGSVRAGSSFCSQQGVVSDTSNQKSVILDDSV